MHSMHSAARARRTSPTGPRRSSLEACKKQCFLLGKKQDRRGPVGDVRLARAVECIQCIAATDMGSDTPLAARRIGSEPLVRWGFALGYSFLYYVCFAQTAALQREGRAPCEKNRGHVRLGRWSRTSVVPQGYSSSGCRSLHCLTRTSTSLLSTVLQREWRPRSVRLAARAA